MQPVRVVIVGAGLAGLRTAERLRRGGYEGRLTLVGTENHLPYDRPPLSKTLLTTRDAPELPVLRKPERWTELEVDLRLGVAATGLDAARRRLSLSDGAELDYDHLVIATGLAARSVPAWSELQGVHTLRTFEDCLQIRAAADAARHATVLGAGVLGSEIASSLRSRGLDVALIDALPQPLCRAVGAEVGAFVADLHSAHGVALHLGRSVARLATGTTGGATEVTLDDGTTWNSDLVVAAIGGTPVTDWLADSGLELEDGVVVDARGATSAPGIWAVGDVAAVADPRGGGRLRIEHWTAAGDFAGVVATNVLAALRGSEPKEHVEVPYMWSDQYDVKVQCLGLPRAGDEVVVLTGSLAERTFLVTYVEDGRVRAIAGAGMPGPLMRCRSAVAEATPLRQLQEAAPWDRKKVSA